MARPALTLHSEKINVSSLSRNYSRRCRFTPLRRRLLSARGNGNNQAKGLRLPLSDLLIGVTALEAGYGVGTSNSSSLSAYSGSVNHADLIGSADICRT